MEEVKSRPPKRRVVQEMEAKVNSTPSRRSSRSTDGSPTQISRQSSVTPTPARNTPLRRTTRLSLDSDHQNPAPVRVTRTHGVISTTSTPAPIFTPSAKSPLANGLMRNGRNKNFSSGGRRAGREVATSGGRANLPHRPAIQPIVDSFSVYRSVTY